jgi:hypothetical protein
MADGCLVTVQQEADILRQRGDRADDGRHDHARAVVSAHGVDGNHQGLGQDGALVLRRVSPDSPAKIASGHGNANKALSA